MREERLGGLLYRWREDCFPLGEDSLALGAFATLRRGERVCDLGCGCGLLGLLLFRREPTVELLGVELFPPAAALAEENWRRSGVKGHVSAGDLRRREDLPPPGSCHGVICNPPYYAAGTGGVGRQGRSEESCTLEEVCAAAAWCLKNGGRLALVYPPTRLSELFCSLTAHSLEPKRLQFIRPSAAYPPSAALVECVKGGGRGLSVLPDRWKERGG